MAYNAPDLTELKREIKKISQDLFLLRELINHTGHAGTHYNGNETPSHTTMQNIIDKGLYTDSSYTEAIPNDKCTANELYRIVHQGVSATHFATQADMFYALHTALYNNAHDIAKWILSPQSEQKFPLYVDTGRFVAGGISTDGQQYVSSVATVVLAKTPSTLTPFSLVTMYADINPEHARETEGSIVRTGKSYGDELAKSINLLPPSVERIYWSLKDKGHDVEMHQPDNFHHAPYLTVEQETPYDYDTGSPIIATATITYDGIVNNTPGLKLPDGQYVALTKKNQPTIAQYINEGGYEYLYATIREELRQSVVRDAQQAVDEMEHFAMPDKLFPEQPFEIIEGTKAYYNDIDESFKDMGDNPNDIGPEI